MLAATPALVNSGADAERALPRLLAQLVVIDTPPEILVPIVAEPMATRTAGYVLGMLDGIEVDRERIVGFLPTQLAGLDVPVLPPIPSGIAAAEAPLAGEAVTTYAPRSVPGRTSVAAPSPAVAAARSAIGKPVQARAKRQTQTTQVVAATVNPKVALGREPAAHKPVVKNFVLPADLILSTGILIFRDFIDAESDRIRRQTNRNYDIANVRILKSLIG